MKNIVKSFLLLGWGLSCGPDTNWLDVINEQEPAVFEKICNNLKDLSLLRTLNKRLMEQLFVSPRATTVIERTTTGPNAPYLRKSTGHFIIIQQGCNAKVSVFFHLIPQDCEIGPSLLALRNIEKPCGQCCTVQQCKDMCHKIFIPETMLNIKSLLSIGKKIKQWKHSGSEYITYIIQEPGMESMGYLLHLMDKAHILKPFDILTPNLIGITEFKVALQKLIELIKTSLTNESYEQLTNDECMQALYVILNEQGQNCLRYTEEYNEKFWKWFDWEFNREFKRDGKFAYFDANFCSAEFRRSPDTKYKANLGIATFIILNSLDRPIPAGTLLNPLFDVFDLKFKCQVTSSSDLSQKILNQIVYNIQKLCQFKH